MINITRPVAVTQKIISKTEKHLDNNSKERISAQQVIDGPKIQMNSREFSRESLEKAIGETNKVLFSNNDHFEFRIHEGTGRIMVKLVDNKTDEVIKEMPPEKILDLVASIWDLVGILVDERG